MDLPQFERFAKSHGEAAVRTGRALTGDWHSGADLAQDALTRLYLAWPRLADESKAWSYLRRTMVRLHLRHSRRKWNREKPSGAVFDRGLVEGPSYDDELVRALSALPPRQRAVLVLRFFLDLSIDDTAAALACTAGTVKSQTSKGLASLRARLVLVNVQE